jgi:hypothetical protein
MPVILRERLANLVLYFIIIKIIKACLNLILSIKNYSCYNVLFDIYNFKSISNLLRRRRT